MVSVRSFKLHRAPFRVRGFVSNVRSRIAFLFGAGASNGAGRVEPFPTPLGSGLFSELRNGYPLTWGQLPADSISLFHDGFEKGMEYVYDKYDYLVPELTIDMALYFSLFRLPSDSSDCYSSLVGFLVKHELASTTAFATLNYDMLLEMGVMSFGLGFAYFEALGSAGSVPMWKLHGSPNFILGVPNLTAVGNQYAKVNQVSVGPIIAVSPSEVRRYYEGRPGERQSTPPMMSVFAPGKPTQVSRETLDDIRRQWAEWALNAKVIVVVGARPILTESHIWKPVLDSSGKVMYVGGSDGLDQLRERLGGRLDIVGNRFREALPDIERALA